LSCGFYFYFPDTFYPNKKAISPTPCPALPLRPDRRSTYTLKPRAGTVLVPLQTAESSATGQERHQGCAVCGAPSDPLDETREPTKRAVCRGRRLLVLFAKESGSTQSHSPCHPRVGWYSAGE
jgi:hypothetical protein